MEDNLEDVESQYSDHFGLTPATTPYGSQDSFAYAIDLSDGEETSGDEHQSVDVNERIQTYFESIDTNPESDTEENTLNRDDVSQQNTVELDCEDYEDLQKVRGIRRQGCKCHMGCTTKFSESDMINHVQNVREMEKNDKDMYIMGTLVDFDKESTQKGKKRMRSRKKFIFQGQRVCKNFFMVVYGIGERSLKSLILHMDMNGPVQRTHGNSGRSKAHSLIFEDIRAVVQFIVNYADINGLPQPAAPRGSDNVPPVYLHCQTTKKHVHSEYLVSLDETRRSVQYSTFTRIWRHCLPHIRIASPKEDVCATCEKLRKQVMDAITEEDKISSTTSMRDHVIAAQNERALYNECIHRARHGNPDGSQYLHFTFDYCQNVTLPHHGRQMGPLYFTTPRKIQIFGVRVDGIPKQLNFLLDENETIGEDGKLSHGPNAVISMLDWAITNYGNGESSCAFHADNCPGQNKNQFVLGYFMWRVMTGRNNKIEYMMQVPGHARCHIDGGFGLIKKLYQRSDCDSINQLEDVVNKSADSNEAVRYPAWLWRDWKSFLSRMFQPIKGIRNYQYFKFSSDQPGIVTVRKDRDGPESCVRMTKDANIHIGDELPVELLPMGLTEERQRYLYRVVRPYVRPAQQDVTCPPI